MTKILLNKSFGGFDLPQEFLKALYQKPETKNFVTADIDSENKEVFDDIKIYDSLSARTNKDIISLFEKMYPNGYDGHYSKIRVQEVDETKYPNWFVQEYDGAERIIEALKYRGFSEA